MIECWRAKLIRTFLQTRIYQYPKLTKKIGNGNARYGL
jgi:hypothetical protein